jgi:hypothetical protein
MAANPSKNAVPRWEEADRLKKAGPIPVELWDEVEVEAGEEETSWLEEAFWALDRIITPRVLTGFFIAASVYFLYHITMFCLRINHYGF